MKNQKWTPAALGGMQFEMGHAGSHVTRMVSVFCLCVILVIIIIIIINWTIFKVPYAWS